MESGSLHECVFPVSEMTQKGEPTLDAAGDGEQAEFINGRKVGHGVCFPSADRLFSELLITLGLSV